MKKDRILEYYDWMYESSSGKEVFLPPAIMEGYVNPNVRYKKRLISKKTMVTIKTMVLGLGTGLLFGSGVLLITKLI